MPTPQIDLEFTECVVCHSSQAVTEARGKDYLHQTSDQEFLFCRCLDCGHLYLRPRPTIAEIGRIYPSNYPTFTNRFGRSGSLFAKVKDQVLVGRFDVLCAGLPASMRLLDIGCGDGRFLLALRRRFPVAELTGLDWFFGPAIAEELAKANIKTIAGTIENTPLPDKKFDVITMNQIIEHTWDVRLVIERCKRALAVGGLLAIETPNPDGWDRRFFKAGACRTALGRIPRCACRLKNRSPLCPDKETPADLRPYSPPANKDHPGGRKSKFYRRGVLA